MELGFLPGTSVRLVRRVGVGDLVEFEVRGSHISLRGSEASRSCSVADGGAAACPRHAPSSQRAQALVAVAGNPNTGKTTLFNRLTGAQHKVGNYPGITVERHTGTLRLPSGRAIGLVDVPGAYSLSARSREEEIAIQTIAGLGPSPRPTWS
jgi:GTPase involved in cell partitioning and DNA repair